MTDVVVVLCTAPAEEATALADRALEERLAACVNLIGPVQSRYRWRGEIESAQEVLMVLKTRRDLAAELRARLAEWHSYEVPEVLELGVEGGLPAYLRWVAESCR